MRNAITLVALTILTCVYSMNVAHAAESNLDENHRAQSERWEPYDGSTVVAQSLIGGLGGLGLGVGAGLTVGALCDTHPTEVDTSPDGDWEIEIFSPCEEQAILVGSALTIVGTLAGVQLTGWALGGNGNFGGTTLGLAAGIVGAIGLVVALGPVGLVLAPLAPATGAILGYHMTASVNFQDVGAVPMDGGAVFQAGWRF